MNAYSNSNGQLLHLVESGWLGSSSYPADVDPKPCPWDQLKSLENMQEAITPPATRAILLLPSLLWHYHSLGYVGLPKKKNHKFTLHKQLDASLFHTVKLSAYNMILFHYIERGLCIRLINA